LQSLRLVAFRQHHQKFLAPMASYKIIGTNHLDDAARDFPEHFIAQRVSVGVIDLFELVQIKHKDTGGPLRTKRAVNCAWPSSMATRREWMASN
jgi:hypothetical protein